METLKRLQIFRKTRATILDPQESYYAITSRMNRSCQVVLGMDLLTPGFSFVNPQFIFLLAIMTSFLYSDIESAILAEDIGGFIYNIAVFGFGLQGFAKFDAYLYRRPDYHKLLHLLGDFMGECNSNDRWKQKMIDSVAICIIFAKFYFGMYTLVFLGASMIGILMSLWSGELQLSFGFQFSFIDTSGFVGYIFTYLYQIIAVLEVVLSSFCNESLIVMVFVNAFGMCDCIISDLKELSKLSQLEKTPENRREAKEKMKLIIQKHQNVIVYLDLANTIFSTYFCMSLVAMTGTISILLIVLVWLRWYPAIFLASMASIQILNMCFLGTLLLLKGEELEREIYVTTWYDLDVPVQQSLKLLLLASQNIKEISYRFGVMNMETYVQTHKLIYSFFAMLVTTKE
ncbi:odorant receptor 49b-like [Toxorhynchites rutilus septentrionalis]|uniref:odorant receptor 49b-like n=1 Tax=Toxorhynchites rutilus septentrionalis TaxID=329112 RepID=UPI00247A452A|nr:odorant receptor 49b-like [Toxorhynchites rutilus septentrionalis]